MAQTLSEPVGKSKTVYQLGSLIVFLAISFLTLGLGGWLTSLGMDEWYTQLNKPSWQPPGWVFAPVWTTLMTLTAIATWRVWERRQSPIAKVALSLYAAQILLNLCWSLLFFTLQTPPAALVEIAILDVVLLGMVVTYMRICKLAGGLMVPYALWLGLATALNIWIVWNN